MSKGLAVRWYSGYDRLLRKLCDIVTPALDSRLASNHALLKCAATGFRTLVTEDWIFNRDCGATVSVSVAAVPWRAVCNPATWCL